jgi:WD40 repeat protein
VAFSPDGKRVVTASDDNTARLWNANDGKLLVDPLKGHAGEVRAVAFSPDGTRVATASEDHTARLWDATDGKLLAILPSSGAVRSVAFSPDGLRLATASDDGTAGIWAATPEGFLIQACQYLRPWPAYEQVADACGPYVDRTIAAGGLAP